MEKRKEMETYEEKQKKQELKNLKAYCINYIEKKSPYKCQYLKTTRISKNGVFIYGKKYYTPRFFQVYNAYTYISYEEKYNVDYVNGLLDTFIEECKNLEKESYIKL